MGNSQNPRETARQIIDDPAACGVGTAVVGLARAIVEIGNLTTDTRGCLCGLLLNGQPRCLRCRITDVLDGTDQQKDGE